MHVYANKHIQLQLQPQHGPPRNVLPTHSHANGSFCSCVCKLKHNPWEMARGHALPTTTVVLCSTIEPEERRNSTRTTYRWRQHQQTQCVAAAAASNINVAAATRKLVAAAATSKLIIASAARLPVNVGVSPLPTSSTTQELHPR